MESEKNSRTENVAEGSGKTQESDDEALFVSDYIL